MLPPSRRHENAASAGQPSVEFLENPIEKNLKDQYRMRITAATLCSVFGGRGFKLAQQNCRAL